MAEDWAIDVKKYVPGADDAVIAGIVRYCGIALRNVDSSLVAFSDPAETGRVRENFLKKKLGLVEPDSVLDTAIASVGERMKADRTKNRVTVYYLLAEAFGKLSMFISAKDAAARAAAGTGAPVAVAPLFEAPVAAPAAVAPVAPVAPVPAYAPVTAAAPVVARRAGGGKVPWATILPVALLVVGGVVVYSIVSTPKEVAAPVVMAAAPAAVVVSVPEGDGIVTEVRDGKPALSVYFGVGSKTVAADFAAQAADVKAYADANPGQQLIVSGYNDPTGDAAMNAELSKNRAQAVAASLGALGVPEARIVLEKPAETSDTTTTLENARRVDVVLR